MESSILSSCLLNESDILGCLIELWRQMDSKKFKKIISWSRSGLTILIHDNFMFSTELCQRIFLTDSFEYFCYFLICCDFYKVDNERQWEFCHKNFVRHDIEELNHIKPIHYVVTPSEFTSNFKTINTFLELAGLPGDLTTGFSSASLNKYSMISSQDKIQLSKSTSVRHPVKYPILNTTSLQRQPGNQGQFSNSISEQHPVKYTVPNATSVQGQPGNQGRLSNSTSVQYPVKNNVPNSISVQGQLGYKGRLSNSTSVQHSVKYPILNATPVQRQPGNRGQLSNSTSMQHPVEYLVPKATSVQKQSGWKHPDFTSSSNPECTPDPNSTFIKSLYTHQNSDSAIIFDYLKHHNHSAVQLVDCATPNHELMRLGQQIKNPPETCIENPTPILNQGSPVLEATASKLDIASDSYSKCSDLETIMKQNEILLQEAEILRNRVKVLEDVNEKFIDGYDNLRLIKKLWRIL